MSQFDRQHNRLITLFWIIFTVAVVGTVSSFAVQAYLVVRYGPKVLNTADKALDKADSWLGKE